MENATTKTSSNIAEIASKFAKVCKLKSIGVFSNETPSYHYNQNPNKGNGTSMVEDSNDGTEETECEGDKIRPHPGVLQSEGNLGGDGYVFELFDAVSALKLAYIQLQRAHVPYDLDKIVAADGLFVAQLQALCKIKRTCDKKPFIKSKLDSSHFECLQAEVNANEELLEKLKSQNRVKNTEIASLQQKLHDLDLGNSILAERMRQMILEKELERTLNIDVFKETFKQVSKSIHDFAKPVISFMKASGWDLDLAANSIEKGVVYSKRLHKKYAFEAFIARRMFDGMLLRSYAVDDVMRLDDPLDSLIQNPGSEFAKFCREKYLFVVHSLMEMSFFGNLDQRMFVLSGKHPRTPFYQLFAKMAKWIWVLQGIATSIDHKAKIFAVNRGSKFSDDHMEFVEDDGVSDRSFDERYGICRVEFMIMPGFRIGDTLVKARVYVSKMNPSLGAFQNWPDYKYTNKSNDFLS